MSHSDNKGQKGQALIWSLIVLAIGSLVIIPTLNYATTAIKSVDISEESMVNEYSAEAAFDWAMYQLLHTNNVDVDDQDPTWEGAVDINGATIPVILSLVPLGDFIDEALPGVDIDYTIPAGHWLELKVIVPDDTNPQCSDDIWFAYDSANLPAQVYLPTSSGIVSYYWHNNPTPPVGDTESQHPLPLDTTAPTGDTVYNYDTDCDDEIGRLIQKGGSGASESDGVKMQEWRTTTPFTEPFHIDGTVGLLYWWGMKDFDSSKTAAGTFYLRDYDGSSYTEIGQITHIESEWARLYDFMSTVNDVTLSGRVKLFADRVEILSWNME